MSKEHFPVMLTEAIDGLQVRVGKTYVDCNLGFGGHTSRILQTGGKVIGFDVDKFAIEFCSQEFETEITKGNLKIVKDNFRSIDKHIKTKVDGILYDLGMSMHQLKKQKKGFSFEDKQSIDMRMDEELGVTGSDFIKALNVRQLEEVIRRYGEEKNAKRYAEAIKALYAKSKKEPTAFEIGEEIKKLNKGKSGKIHPATKTFQAIRIAVNSELDNLRESLAKATRLLVPGGRLVIISFHSLEDEISKELAESPELKKITAKPLTPSKEEIEINPPSRSAKLRIYEKL